MECDAQNAKCKVRNTKCRCKCKYKFECNKFLYPSPTFFYPLPPLLQLPSISRLGALIFASILEGALMMIGVGILNGAKILEGINDDRRKNPKDVDSGE